MPAERRLKTLDEFTVADLEGIRLLLGGGSVIDWYRLNFRDDEEIRGFVRSIELLAELPWNSISTIPSTVRAPKP